MSGRCSSCDSRLLPPRDDLAPDIDNTLLPPEGTRPLARAGMSRRMLGLVRTMLTVPKSTLGLSTMSPREASSAAHTRHGQLSPSTRMRSQMRAVSSVGRTCEKMVRLLRRARGRRAGRQWQTGTMGDSRERQGCGGTRVSGRAGGRRRGRAAARRPGAMLTTRRQTCPARCPECGACERCEAVWPPQRERRRAALR